MRFLSAPLASPKVSQHPFSPLRSTTLARSASPWTSGACSTSRCSSQCLRYAIDSHAAAADPPPLQPSARVVQFPALASARCRRTQPSPSLPPHLLLVLERSHTQPSPLDSRLACAENLGEASLPLVYCLCSRAPHVYRPSTLGSRSACAEKFNPSQRCPSSFACARQRC